MEKTKTTKFLGSFSLSKNGGGAGGTTNYDDLINKPKVNGVTLSGNKTSADLGITTLTPFPSTWPTTGQFEDLLAAIRVDTIAVKGASFLGEVTFDDLPANLGNAEIKVEILEGTTSATKVIHSVITSGNREPYRWEYTSWNSGNSNSGWISFQLPLTAGDGISIENNVISATGGNVYTQNNLLAGNGIEIVNEPVEGGIDNHTLACWHFDGNVINLGTDQDFTINTETASYDTLHKQFGESSIAPSAYIKVPSTKVYTNPLTFDFWCRVTNAYWGPFESSYLPEKVGFQRSGNSLVVNRNGSVIITCTTNISDSNFHHYAVIYTLNDISVYIDGILQGKYDRIVQDISITNNRFLGPNNIDELRISDIARQLTPDGKFPVPARPYSLAVPTGNKVINNTITKTSQLTNDSGFLTSVPENLVTSDNVTKIVKLTQAEYDQLETKDDGTFYAIVG